MTSETISMSGRTAGAAIAVIGVGYVGLPLALALAGRHPRIIAFDSDAARIAELARGHDRNDPEGAGFETPDRLCFTADPAALRQASVYIVTVPTPIDEDRRPDLAPLRAACATIGDAIARGDLVVFESTVYPGLTEEVCAPLIAERAGLAPGRDFQIGYSPERVNPGDGAHTVANVTKIVAGQDAATLERVAAVYAPVVRAGLHRAPSIKVAEAAKVTENVQRDVNIALMNELALIFERLGIRTADVVAAAATKWNFQPFTPGLVGGHCVGVDPYYLISRAEALGYYPEVIRAARRLNNAMAGHVAQRTLELLSGAGMAGRPARVGILGITFKEDVPDFRNSQVPMIAGELSRFGVTVLVHDPLADPDRLAAEHDIRLVGFAALQDLDGLILAVPHAAFTGRPLGELLAGLRPGGALIDVRAAIDPARLPAGQTYWSL